MPTDFSGFPASRPAAASGFGMGFRYTFSFNTADLDPGNGMLRLSSSTQPNSTRLTIDNVDASGSDIVSYFLNYFTGQIVTNKGLVILTHLTDPSKWSVFRVTAMDSGLIGYFNLTVANVSWSGIPFTNNDPILVHFDAGVDLLNTSDIITSATNDDAGVGKIGELLTATLASGSATSISTATAKTVISKALTAGDWDVTGVVVYVTAATTNITIAQAGISQTDNTISANFYERNIQNYGAHVPGANSGPGIIAPTTRVSIAGGGGTVYLIALLTFTVSTATAYGTIRATRRR